MRKWRAVHGMVWMTALVIMFASSASAETAWVRQYDGPASANDHASSMAVDGSGNVYVVGGSEGVETGYDFTLVKYDRNGNQLCVTQLDGSGTGRDSATAVVVDDAGFVYATGTISNASSGNDYWTVKFGPSCDTLWARTYDGPGNGDDVALDLVVDETGNLFVTGKSTGLEDYDVATIKYSPAGEELWVARHAGTGTWRGDDCGYSIALSSSGKLFVAGSQQTWSMSAILLTYDLDGNEECMLMQDGAGGAYDKFFSVGTDSAGDAYMGGVFGYATADYVIRKADTACSLAWGDAYDGGGTDWTRALAVDAQCNSYLTGSSYNASTSADYSTVKYDTAGSQVWVRHFDGPASGYDSAYAIAVDMSGNVYVTGRSRDGSGISDIVTVKYDSDGNEIWIETYSSCPTCDDAGSDIALDDAGNVYITGSTWSAVSGYDWVTIRYGGPCDTLRIAADCPDIYYGPGGYPDDVRVSVDLANCSGISGLTVPLAYDPLPTGWELDSVSFAGGRMTDWAVVDTTIDRIGRTVVVHGIGNMGGAGPECVIPGEGPLFYLWFSSPPDIPSIFDDLTDVICIDTTTIAGIDPKSLLFADCTSPVQGFAPAVDPGCVTLHHFRYGALNIDPGTGSCADLVVDVLDVVHLIDYVFRTGPEPCVLAAGDVNCDEQVDVVIDVLDVVQVIDYTFRSGSLPMECGCNTQGGSSPARIASSRAITELATRVTDDGRWEVTLEVDATEAWRAAQLEWELDERADDLSVDIGGDAALMQTYWSINGRTLTVGLLDIRGEATVESNSRTVLRISGSGAFPGVRLIEGILVNLDNQPMPVEPISAYGQAASVPLGFRLGSNYPNPFNAGTMIEYTTGGDGHVRLSVYDILGRRVATLVDEFQGAGKHTVDWGARTASGQPIASGIYFYRMTAADYAESRKMVLLK